MAEDAVQRMGRPLVIDLDGTLVRTDLLYESYFNTVANGPVHHWAIFRNLLKGKAPLKAYLASVSTLDYKTLPYDAAVLDLISAARREGRPIYLATASDQRHISHSENAEMARPSPTSRRASKPLRVR